MIRGAAWLLVAASLVAAQAPGRGSITFLMGRDEPGGLPMFALAARHFRTHAVERTDRVVEGLHTLREVRDHLARHPAPDGRPWGLVNLVLHASPEGVPDCLVEPEGVRMTESALAEAVRAKRLVPLPGAILDGTSEVRVHGCAVGRHPELLRRLSQVLGGSDAQRPLVRASPWYTCFQPLLGPRSRILVQAFEVEFRPGARPDTPTLVAAFRRQHPEAGDVGEALERHLSPDGAQPFSLEGPATFTWTFLDGGAGLPGIPATQASRVAWVMGRPELSRLLARHGTQPGLLQWEMETLDIPVPGGARAALRVVGRGRRLTVLRPILERPGGSLPERAWEDPVCYTSAR